MPRTTTLESSGCPPLRALATDVLGLIKVVEARAKPAGIAKAVETWGIPDASRVILADRAVDPLSFGRGKEERRPFDFSEAIVQCLDPSTEVYKLVEVSDQQEDQWIQEALVEDEIPEEPFFPEDEWF